MTELTLPRDELTRPIAATDEFAHAPAGADNWRENWWLTFFDHRQGIRGVVYGNYQPLLGRGFALIKLYRGTLPLLVFNDAGIPAAACSHGDGLVGPTEFTCVEPMTRWRIQVRHPLARLDLTWSALAPAYDWDWGAETTSRHYEQSGAIAGRLTLGDEQVDLAGWGQRDRAWGHRDPSIIQDAWSSRVFFGEGDVQHAAIIRAQGHAFLFGYLLRDGRRELLDRLELDIEPAYEGGPPLTTRLRATTEAGTDLEQTVRLASVVGNVTTPNGRATQQFFTFSEFQAGDRRAVGQLDSWWAAPRDPANCRSQEGNRGRWVAT